jgi:hypothetical protein
VGTSLGSKKKDKKKKKVGDCITEQRVFLCTLLQPRREEHASPVLWCSHTVCSPSGQEAQEGEEETQAQKREAPA